MIEVKTLEEVYTREVSGCDTISYLPVGNTPLEEMVGNFTVGALVTNETSGLPSMEEIAKYINSDPEHTAVMAATKDLGVKAVRYVSDLVKNTVNPHIRSILDSVRQQMQYLDGTLPWNLEVVEEDPLLSHPVTFRIVESLPTPKTFTNSTLKHPVVNDFSVDDLVNALKVTDDGDYNSLLSNIDKEVAHRIIDILKGGSDLDLNSDGNVALYIIIALMNIKTPPAGMSMSLIEWEGNRANTLMRANGIIKKYIGRIQNSRKMSVLYSAPFNEDSKIIRINARVYREMVAKGLTPEVVIGNEILNRRFISDDLLKPAVAEECKKVYDFTLDTHKMAAAQRKEYKYLETVMKALRADLDRIANNEEWPVDGDNRDKAWQRLRKTTEEILLGRYRDEPLDDQVAAIVLATWYAHTDAWRLLDIASHLQSEYPDITPEELFLMAKIRYVAQWVASMLKVNGDLAAKVEVDFNVVEKAIS